MTKARSADARREVERLDRKDAPESFGYFQSCEFQEKLERARAARQKVLAERTTLGKTQGTATSGGHSGNVLPRKEPSFESKNWLEQLEWARQQRKKILSQEHENSSVDDEDASLAEESSRLQPEFKQKVLSVRGMTARGGNDEKTPERPKDIRPDKQVIKSVTLEGQASPRSLDGIRPTQTNTEVSLSTDLTNESLKSKGASEEIAGLRQPSLSSRERTNRWRRNLRPAALGLAAGALISTVAITATEWIKRSGPRAMSAPEPSVQMVARPKVKDGVVQLRMPNSNSMESGISQPFDALWSPNASRQSPVLQSAAIARDETDTLTLLMTDLGPVDARVSSVRRVNPIKAPAQVHTFVPALVTADTSFDIKWSKVNAPDRPTDSSDPIRFRTLAGNIQSRVDIEKVYENTSPVAETVKAPLAKPEVTYKVATTALTVGNQFLQSSTNLGIEPAIYPARAEETLRRSLPARYNLEDLIGREVAVSVGDPWKRKPITAFDGDNIDNVTQTPSLGPPKRFARLQPMPALATDLETAHNDADMIVGEGSGAFFQLFAPAGLSEDDIDAVEEWLMASGHQRNGTSRVTFNVNRTNVRFYHSEDAAKAAELAKAADALLRDFTGANSKTPPGMIELWLEGKSGVAPKAKPKKRGASAPRRNIGLELRNKVISNLRRMTN